MKIRESTVEEVLRSEDLESLFQHGAPDNEYTPEVRGIMSALALLGDNDITEDRLTAVIRDVWTRLFGPFGDDELEMRMAGGPYVQRKAGVFSGGVKPARAKVSSPVAWMAGGRETELRESIDKAIFRGGERVVGP